MEAGKRVKMQLHQDLWDLGGGGVEFFLKKVYLEREQKGYDD